MLGSEQQKQLLLPRMASLEWTGAWALTEPSNGSDASALESTARQVAPPGIAVTDHSSCIICSHLIIP